MALAGFIRRAIRTSGANPSFPPASTWPSSLAPSSYYINDDRSLSLSAVYRAVVLISSMAASMPLHVYRQRNDDSRERDQEPGTRFLWRRPNPEMSSQTFWEMVIGHEVMGDAFMFVEKNRNGSPLSLWPIDPGRVRVGRTENNLKVYEVDNELPMKDFTAGGEMVHVPNWSRSNLRGISPIQFGANALSLGLSAQSYAERFFSQSAIPPAIITTEANLTQAQAEELSRQWERHRAGLENAHRTAVMGSGAKYQQISVSPADAQLLEERKFTVTEVCRLFGVPPWMLYDVDHASQGGGNGLEGQFRTFVITTLGAHLIRFEQAMDHAFLADDQYTKFNLDAMLRGTTTERYQAYALGYGRWLSTNDIRRREDLPPVDGGDDVLAAQNLIPLELLGAAQGNAPTDTTPLSFPRAANA